MTNSDVRRALIAIPLLGALALGGIFSVRLGRVLACAWWGVDTPAVVVGFEHSAATTTTVGPNAHRVTSPGATAITICLNPPPAPHFGALEVGARMRAEAEAAARPCDDPRIRRGVAEVDHAGLYPGKSIRVLVWGQHFTLPAEHERSLVAWLALPEAVITAGLLAVVLVLHWRTRPRPAA